MRSHPYGRHGPHAWRRWRERRYGNLALKQVQKTRIVVVRLRISLVNGERIVVVMQPEPDETEARNNRGLPSPTVEGTVEHPTGPLPQAKDNKQQEIPDNLQTLAYLAGSNRAQREREAGDYDNLPSQQQLQHEAKTFATQTLREQIFQGRLSVKIGELNMLTQQVADMCLKTYNEEMAKYEDTGIIPDESTREIRQIAWTDKASHPTPDRPLSPEYVRYLGTARAMRHLGIDTELSLEDLDEIHAFVDVYRRYYQQPAKESKEVGRQPRPSGF